MHNIANTSNMGNMSNMDKMGKYGQIWANMGKNGQYEQYGQYVVWEVQIEGWDWALGKKDKIVSDQSCPIKRSSDHHRESFNLTDLI